MTRDNSNKPPREVELKLAIPDGPVGELLEHPVFRSAARPAAQRHEVTTYFDTQDLALSQRGISLRVRGTGGKYIQTLKNDQKSGVVADRAEWEWPVEHDKPDLTLLEEVPIAKELPRALDLEPVLVTDFSRTIRVLELDDGAVVEAALDEGVIISGDARQPVRELELEMRKGDPAVLYRLALELHATVPLRIESQSKAARGYLLRSGAVPTARKAEDIELKQNASAAEAFRQILTDVLGHLLVNQPTALSGDAEGVHQMRVAIRRLRAALTLFEPLLEPHTSSRFQTELRRVGQVFGEARDWDVFCLQTLADPLEAAGAAGWRDLLRAPALAHREVAHQHFAEELMAPPFTTLVLGLAAWSEDNSLLSNPNLQRSVEDACPALLDRLARKVERRGRHLQRRSDAERHALRKSLKKLRYASDYMQALFPPERVKSYLHKCKKLQQSLGDINDTVTATTLLDQLGEEARPDLAPAAGALLEELKRRREEAVHSLSKRWKTFQNEPRFWE